MYIWGCVSRKRIFCINGSRVGCLHSRAVFSLQIERDSLREGTRGYCALFSLLPLALSPIYLFRVPYSPQHILQPCPPSWTRDVPFSEFRLSQLWLVHILRYQKRIYISSFLSIKIREQVGYRLSDLNCSSNDSSRLLGTTPIHNHRSRFVFWFLLFLSFGVVQLVFYWDLLNHHN